MGLKEQGRRLPASIRNISLLIGAGGDLTLMMAIVQNPSYHVNSKGRQSDWVRVATIQDAARVASTAQLNSIVADTAICAAHDSLVDVRGRSVPIRPVSSEIERFFGRASVQHANTRHDTTGVDSEKSPTYLVSKRIVDLALGTVALAVLAIPVAILYAFFCACFGASSIIEVKTLVGMNGKPFTLRQLNFVPLDLADDSTRSRCAQATNRALGHLHIRLWPALVNVLTGEMTLVGPRPESASAIERGSSISKAYPLRLLIKPGIVSLAGVRFSYSDSSRDTRLALEYDLHYVKQRSLVLDARILARALELVTRDIVETVFHSLHAVGRILVKGAAELVGNDSLRAARIASVAMPTDPSGRPLDLKPTLVIGAGEGGKLIVHELQSDTGSGLWPVAFVDDDPSLLGARIRNVPVLGNTAAIRAVVEREHIETIVLAIPSAGELDRQRIAAAARDTSVPMLSMPSIGGILRGDDATLLRAVPTSDFLGRTVVETGIARGREFLGGKNVLVTGAAGSIGRDVVRQALRCEPATIFGLDINESDLYDLQQEIKASPSTTAFVPIVASVTNASRLNSIMQDIQPHVVFHAAAYKHVPLMEDFPYEAVQSNIQGTYHVARAAAAVGVERFVLVSTDKAVRPSSVMGASKRIAELIVRDIAADTGLCACAVRFGNVLGSRGSVIPLFERQIAAGGPITITDKRMTRYFMTISEAAALIIEAGAFGGSGVTYMLDMGEPVAIVDVADRLIRLHGKRPGSDIGIRFTGLRPGEKLFEELSLDFEAARETEHPKIRVLDECAAAERQPAELMMRRLLKVIQTGTPAEIRQRIMRDVAAADGIDVSLVEPDVPLVKADTA